MAHAEAARTTPINPVPGIFRVALFSVLLLGGGPAHARSLAAPKLISAPPRLAAPRLVFRPAGRRDVYDHIIREYSKLYRVDAALVKAVIHAESRFNHRATSRAGARGLMQVMPRTGRAYGVRNLYDPRHNIRVGTRHLRALLRRYRNDVKLAVAAYNAGARKVDRHRGVPPYRETRTFVARVLKYRQHYRQQPLTAVASRS